jgi:asparagine synthase (glutamine-hydrolysing)
MLNSLPNDRLQKIANQLKQKSLDDFITNIYRLKSEFYTPKNNVPIFEKDILINNNHYLQKASDYNINFWLANDSNVKVDRASMSASLEVRSPFLDYRVIEFARTLPIEYRYQKGNKKRILKDLLYKYAPRELFDRPKKGFGVPLDNWFRKELKEYLNDTLTKENLNLIEGINSDVVKQKLKEHQSGKYNHSAVIWNLLVMINWIKNKS